MANTNRSTDVDAPVSRFENAAERGERILRSSGYDSVADLLDDLGCYCHSVGLNLPGIAALAQQKVESRARAAQREMFG